MFGYIDAASKETASWVPIVLIVAGVGIAAAIVAGIFLSMGRKKRADDPLR